MFARTLFAVTAALLLGTTAVAQEPKKPVDPPKPVDPKKEDPKPVKGQLPTYWKMLGLSEEQVQKVYRVHAKYNDEIDTLEAKIKELKDKMAKERLEVLSPEQKKRLEEILKEKSGTGGK